MQARENFEATTENADKAPEVQFQMPLVPRYILPTLFALFFTLSSLRCCSACQSSYWDCRIIP